MERVPVLIVGAGPTGGILAVELARRGVEVLIVEKALERSMESKGMGLMKRTMQALEPSGLLDAFRAEGVQGQGLNFYSEGRHLARIDFEEHNKDRYSSVGMPQYDIERLLIDKAVELGARIERGVELVDIDQDPTGVSALVRSEAGERRIEADWLVGCDGAHSRVRKSCGIEFKGAKIPEQLLAADVMVEGIPADKEMRFFFSSKGLFAMFPMADGRWRVTVDIDGASTDEPEGSLERLERLTDERIGDKLTLKMTDPSWLSEYSVHRRLASTFRRDRCLLAGDAAHIHSPAGGQGMNNGIADAVELAESLHSVLEGGSEKVLDRYSRHRRRVSRRMIWGTTLWLHAQAGRSRPMRGARDGLIRTIAPIVNRRFARRSVST